MSNRRLNTNPFEEEDTANGAPNKNKRITPLISKQPPAPERNGNNPFEFDSGFQTVPKEETPILFGMDADDELEKSVHGHMPPPPPDATTPVTSKTTQQKTFGVKDAMGWLGVKKKDESGHVPLEEDDEEVSLSPMRRKKTVTEWPYDYYHMEQQRYYDMMDMSPQKRNAMPSTPQQDSYVTRPQDLVDIPTAVQDLSLVDFEACAQKRAIGIVSTWIYDEGLMDELIIGGLKNAAAITTSDDVSVKTSEGVEISSKGYAIVGEGKIDKEIDKLRASTSRELALINARLNDGVAASGSEVQELVNAVTATKGDLGKLRELSTYIARGNDNTALLQNYPRLKVAIHARRNLARCFRELDFFTQIPATCERLRDDMHTSEWTEEEWTVLRNVCREHVELEVFLVEAEAGMKARIDAERSPSRATKGAKNYASVDRFLEEHVRIVWELGDEIKLRVLSGVGMTFDLALNNPAGMVALVEAVELYEAAGEEYKAVYGDEHSHDERLHFTDMRRGALEHIAKDFEVRGLEVFQEVQQMVRGASLVCRCCCSSVAAHSCHSRLQLLLHRLQTRPMRIWQLPTLMLSFARRMILRIRWTLSLIRWRRAFQSIGLLRRCGPVSWRMFAHSRFLVRLVVQTRTVFPI